MLFFPPTQTNRVCFWQETAAKTKRFSCLDQQGKEEKDAQRKTRGKKSLVPTHESRKILKTFKSRSTRRDREVFSNVPLATSCVWTQKGFKLRVCEAALFLWLAAALPKPAGKQVSSFVPGSIFKTWCPGEFQQTKKPLSSHPDGDMAPTFFNRNLSHFSDKQIRLMFDHRTRTRSAWIRLWLVEMLLWRTFRSLKKTAIKLLKPRRRLLFYFYLYLLVANQDMHVNFSTCEV